ncbi:MAG TPA: SpoIVB peptidase S55 domain-containing protein [Thermoanaerobaculia bacterium]|nr:SpoIVB peptidase S55 domain-containing protein [Thermoanaerobaculia bacterium]HUM29928.1 SpoIVB peptidase S55 domain-containing protein [Thermoanaerobaculia bacterium]HXK68205.1 SpoIVB peptidase S55 domain-containing protein [Thermoanaerobaculia bacterium]
MFKGFRQFALFILLGSATLAALDVYPVRDVQPGMKGRALTILHGEEKIEFDVDILGVLSEIAPDYPIVLGRMNHPDLESAGIVAGMSGSPVYIDGKLLGAIAYGWGFSKEPFCGITPAEVMLQRRAIRTIPLPPYDRVISLARTSKWEELLSLITDTAASASAGYSSLTPLPLLLHGPAFSMTSPYFEALGCTVSGGGGMKATSTPLHSLEPGDAVAAAMVIGPQSLFASGTVTSVEGEDVMAFGHPFLGIGEVSFPMARAHPVLTVPSLFRSFRMSNMGTIIGTFTHDGRSAVSGRLGEEARMIPVTIKASPGRTESFRIADNPALAPMLAAWTLQTSLSGHPASGGTGTYELLQTMDLGESGSVTVRENFSGDGALKEMSAYSIGVLALLLQNPFQSVQLRSMDIEIGWDSKVSFARIRSLIPDHGRVTPGEKLSLALSLVMNDGTERTEHLVTRVPASPQGLGLTLYAVSGTSLGALMDSLTKQSVSSYSGLLTFLHSLKPSNTLHLVWVSRRPGIRSEDLYIPEAGPRMKTLLQGGTNLPYSVSPESALTFPYPVRGWEKIELAVHDHPGGGS